MQIAVKPRIRTMVVAAIIAAALGASVAVLVATDARRGRAAASLVEMPCRVPRPVAPPVEPIESPSAPEIPASTHGTCTEPDFDGDGAIDRVETVEDSCGTGGCTYRLYLVRSYGDRYLGEIAGRCSFELDPRPGHLADVIATWRLGADELVETRYRFDGKRYRARRRS